MSEENACLLVSVLALGLCVALPSGPVAFGAPSMLPAQLDEKPAAGMFLVAGRDLQDPNFRHTVVLLVDYGRHGAAGVIVNRPSDKRLGELLPEIEGIADRPETVYEGGPVSPRGTLVLLRSETEPEDSQAVFDDVYVTSSRAQLERLLGGKEQFRVYAGYAGWTSGQLDWEIAQGGWWLLPADVGTVFGDAPEEDWRRLVRATSSPLAGDPSRPAGTGATVLRVAP